MGGGGAQGFESKLGTEQLVKPLLCPLGSFD